MNDNKKLKDRLSTIGVFLFVLALPTSIILNITQAAQNRDLKKEYDAEVSALSDQISSVSAKYTDDSTKSTSEASSPSEQIDSLNDYISELEKENEKLKETVSDLEDDVFDLEEDVSEYKDTISEKNDIITELREEKDFFDTYAVIVPNDGRNIYHTYGCSMIGEDKFFIYNINAAASKGYTACSRCHTGYVPDNTFTYYIGNTNSKVFHTTDCSHLPQGDNQIRFNNRSSAVSSGYKPCSHCDP